MPVVHLIRHGQASFGAADYDVLSPVGRRQAEVVAEALVRRGVAPSRMIAGSLRRQRDTGTICAQVAGWDRPLETDPRWDEYDHGARLAADDQKPGREIQQILDAALLDWISSGRPGSDGRTFAQWREGVVAAQREFLGSLGPGGSGVVFTSGGVLAAICADLLGLGPDGFLAFNRVMTNTGVTKVISGRSGTSLISVNDHGHLEGAADLLTYR